MGDHHQMCFWQHHHRCGVTLWGDVPQHFTNACVHGVVSNCWPAEREGDSTLLMADMRCLPGMEGGPVFNQQGQLVAVTMLPLLSTSFNAEVML